MKAHDHGYHEEFADLRKRTLRPLLAHRLQLVRHSRCACGEQATCLHNDVMRCAACSDVARIMARGFQMMSR